MDSKLTLLKEFYSGLPKDRVKLETPQLGFEFLETLLSDGATLVYGEMHRSGSLNKYKLANLSEKKMDELLRGHLAKKNNVCLYFDPVASSIFCINLDNNRKTNNTELIIEIKQALSLLREHLTLLGCEPLIIASGRGYHLWCRLTVPIDNSKLHPFMLRLTAMTLAGLHNQGLDYNQIKTNFYPDPRVRNQVSLRLFGSDHSRNKVFSRILLKEDLLDEEASWEAFENHLHHKTITELQFNEAVNLLTTFFDQ